MWDLLLPLAQTLDRRDRWLLVSLPKDSQIRLNKVLKRCLWDSNTFNLPIVSPTRYSLSYGTSHICWFLITQKENSLKLIGTSVTRQFETKFEKYQFQADYRTTKTERPDCKFAFLSWICIIHDFFRTRQLLQTNMCASKLRMPSLPFGQTDVI